MGPSVRSFLFPPLRFSLRRGLYQQKNVMYCFSRSFPNVVFEFRFSRQIPCLQAAATSLFGINPFVLHPVSGTSCNRFFLSFSQLLSTSVSDSRLYGFLSLINYRVARGGYVAIWKDPLFLPRLVHLRVSHIVLRRVAPRRVVSHRDGRKRRC